MLRNGDPVYTSMEGSMIDLKACRYPVSLFPEDAIKLVEILHELKSLTANKSELYSLVQHSMKIVNQFQLDDREIAAPSVR